MPPYLDTVGSMVRCEIVMKGDDHFNGFAGLSLAFASDKQIYTSSSEMNGFLCRWTAVSE